MVMEDEIYEAEIFQSSSDNVLNITLGATIAVSIIFLILGASVGHVLTEPAPDSESIKEWWLTPLHDRHAMDLDRKAFVAQNRSALPVNGTLEVQTYTEHFIQVDLPASEDDVGFPEEDLMHVALWLPRVKEGKIPVIMSIHPYYDFGGEGMPGVGADSNPNTVPDGGIGKWVYDNFISHGYAFQHQPLALDNQHIAKM